MKNPLNVRLIAAFALLAANGLFAQTAKPSSTKTTDKETEGETYVLSPFMVSTEKDRGYAASTTLSGSRVRTPLEDVGAAISVVTEKFLEDTASTDLKDVLVYTTGTEVSGFGGNFSNANTSVGQNQTADGGISNNPGTRVRGLAAADITRDYLRTNIPFDSYNSGRVEINRGANAVLFGVGSPAGIINYSIKGADLAKQSGNLSFTLDNFGSQRASIDLNVPIIPKQLAVRVDLLDSDKKFEQEPAFKDDTRAYGALTFRPKFLDSESGALSGMTFKAGYENGRIRANNPRTLTPQDRVSIWLNPSAELRALGVPVQPITDPLLSAAANIAKGYVPATQLNGLVAGNPMSRAPVIIFPDPNSAIPLDPISELGLQPNIVGRQWVTGGLLPGGATGTMYISNHLSNAYSRTGLYANNSFIIQPGISDRSMFDYRETLIDGPNKAENDDFDTLSLSLEQLFFKRRAGVELSYAKERTTSDQQSLLSRGTAEIVVDANVRLLDGTPNTNVGRPFSGSAPSASWNRNDVESFRATAFAELNLAERVQPRWAKALLGRHIVTVLHQTEESFAESRSGRPWVLLGNYPYGGNQDRFSQIGAGSTIVSYLGPSLLGATSTAGLHLPGLTADRTNIPEIVKNGTFILRANNTAGTFGQTGVNYSAFDRELEQSSSSATKTLNNLESAALNLQSYFFNDQLVFSTGWRKEKAEGSRVIAPVTTDGYNLRLLNDPGYVFPAVPNAVVEDTLHSWSVVAKIPPRWLARIPLVSGFNLNYSRSENFSPPEGTRLNASGETLPPPTGRTKDYGFTLSLLENRAILRANWYETVQSGVTHTGLTNLYNSIMTIHKYAHDALLQGFTMSGEPLPPPGTVFPLNYIAPPQAFLDLMNTQINGNALSYANPGMAATSDVVSKGVEFEVQLNLTPSWTLAFNGARQEAIRSNSGADLKKLLFETPVGGEKSLYDAWTGPKGQNTALFFGATPNNSATTAGQSASAVFNPFNNAVLQDGAPTQELRKWRFNLVTNYSFRTGRLKGFSVGGSGRWQDKVAAGYPLTTSPIDGSTIIDVKNPYYGPTELNFDAWMGYERKIYNKRITWKIQLNVRNIFAGEDDLIPVRVQINGAPVVFRIAESRLFTLSNKFSF